MDEECKRQCFFYKWRIDNFHFCWHKTGEYLESPLFCVESSPETKWRLLLYPRGEEDGEYISCYLFRKGESEDEVQGVGVAVDEFVAVYEDVAVDENVAVYEDVAVDENVAVDEDVAVDVDFELSISIGEQLVKPPMSFEEFYSFKKSQKEGEKSFALRREIFLQNPFWKEKSTLTVGCRIFKLNGVRTKATERFGRTTIFSELISGMEAFEDIADLNPENSKDIEVKALLETYPLISIKLSHFDENLIIKILPKSCEKIKFAICKITVIKNWKRQDPIEHNRHWVGEIKSDIWRYDVILPRSAQQGSTESAPPGPTESAPPGPTESAQQDIETNAHETFFLHYVFAYSTGVAYTRDELNDYGPDLWISNISSLESTCERIKVEEPAAYPTAKDSLKLFHASPHLADVTIKSKTSEIKAHKVVLCARSSEIANMLKDNPRSIELLTYRREIVWRFLLFLYTDNLEDMQCEIAMDLYQMAHKYKIGLLKNKCRRFIKMNCDVKNVCELLTFSHNMNDNPLMEYFHKYVIDHDEEIFNSDEWKIFAEKYWELAEACMLLKHQYNFPVL